jgi:hypothetical protein
MKMLRVTMPDGSQWDVPVEIIANNRAKAYAEEFHGDVQSSLDEDTLPLFESDPYEVEDWAANQMNWTDVSAHAQCHKPSEVDWQEGWVNGEKEVVEVEEPPSDI